MIQNLKTTIIFSYLEILSYFRVKQAFFFSIIFPIGLLVLLHPLFATDNNSSFFLISGLVAMNISSDSLFSVGPVIKIYKERNILKFLKDLPVHILYSLSGIFISRIFISIISLFLICILSALLFNFLISSAQLLLLLTGICLGTFMMSLLGLVICFYSKSTNDRGILTILNYCMILFSGVFYPVEGISPSMSKLALVLPLTPLVKFMRGETSYLFLLILWILIFGIIFYALTKKASIKR